MQISTDVYQSLCVLVQGPPFYNLVFFATRTLQVLKRRLADQKHMKHYFAFQQKVDNRKSAFFFLLFHNVSNHACDVISLFTDYKQTTLIVFFFFSLRFRTELKHLIKTLSPAYPQQVHKSWLIISLYINMMYFFFSHPLHIL